MLEKTFVKPVLTLILLLAIMPTTTNAEPGIPIIVTSINLQNDGKATFFHKDLFNWHEQIQEQIEVLGLNGRTPERIKDIRRNGHCFKTGECQKEIRFSLPIESLSSYHRFFLLTTEGDTFQVNPEKIEGSALMMVYPDGRLITTSGGSGTIYLRSEKKKLSDRSLIFALPANNSHLVVTRLPDTEAAKQRLKISDRGLLVDGKAVTAKNHMTDNHIHNIAIPFEVSISDRSERFIATTWSADTPCEKNFSLIRVDGDPVEYQWLGWDCDL